MNENYIASPPGEFEEDQVKPRKLKKQKTRNATLSPKQSSKVIKINRDGEPHGYTPSL